MSTRSHPMARALAAVLATCTLMSFATAATPHSEIFRDLQVDIVGTGRPVLMIPGLNSAGSTWNSTCAALQPGVQCHILQLPGFAGTPAIATDHYMEAIRDRVIDYVAAKHLVSRPSNSSAEPSNLF
jgi:pimeloyl-ACP methyl ester carboxylesterase